MSGARQRLFVFVKEPQPGRVKTRLGAGIGLVQAAWWFRHQCRHLLRAVTDPRWHTILAVSPDRQGLTSRVWPPHLSRWPQGRGTLGDRMGRAFRHGLPGATVIIGADIPEVSAADIDAAFRALGDHDAVIGPAPDGGFWLIGFSGKSPPPTGLFKGVRWSTEYALADTLRTMPHLSVARLRELNDVDEVADL